MLGRIPLFNLRKDQSQLKRRFKKINWGVHRRLAEEYFQKVVLQAKEDGFFENLYISVNDNKRQIQLSAGNHPAGPLEPTFDQLDNRTGQRFPIEGGASLVISQGANGFVCIILYPFRSERMNMKTSYITWAVFSDPTKLTEYVLLDVIRDFFIYMNVSSVHFSESRYERLRIKYLELKGQKYSDSGGLLPFVVRHFKEMIFIAGAIGSAYGVFK